MNEPVQMPRVYKALMLALEVTVCAIGVGALAIVIATAVLMWGAR